MRNNFSFNSRPVTKFVSSPCGCGKTYAVCQYISANQSLRNHIYVAPSRQLIAETRNTLAKMGVTATVITCDTSPGHVTQSIIHFLNGASELGEVLLITWNAYVDLPYINRLENWQIIIDEVPQLDRFHAWMLPRNLTFLTEHIDINDSSVNERVSKVVVKDRPALQQLLESGRDDVNELFRKFFRDLLSPSKDMFVDTESWNRLVEDGGFSEDEESNRLFFISMLRPEPFRDAILLGANVSDSLVYHWLTRYHECRFVEHKPIANSLRAIPANLGSRLKVSYLIPGRNSSKALYRRTATTGGNLIDLMDRAALEAFGSAPFLYVSNNDRKSVIDEQPTATRISVVSHGLNKYETHTNIYFSAALNREPKHFWMLKALGLDANHVHRASAHEMLYQCVLRTALRDPTSTEGVHAIVSDEPSARRLAALVGTNDVSQLGSLYSPPHKPLTATQKHQRHEAKKAREALYEPKAQPSRYINESGMDSGASVSFEDPLDLESIIQSLRCAEGSRASRVNSFCSIYADNSLQCFVTFHRDERAFIRDDFIVAELSINEFLTFLRRQFRAVIDKKADSMLFNSCVFDPPAAAEGFRRKDYFKQSSFMVLDFDNGNLSPEEFERIFWCQAGRGQKRSFVICNSFSRCATTPNKFRVILFYKRPAATLEAHEAVFDAIVSRLEANGFTADSAKIDPACRSGNQSFYLPCTNRGHQDWAFFRAYGTKTRDLERCAIDPVLYGKTAVLPQALPKIAPNSIFPNVSRQRIDEVTAHLKSLTEDRHQPLFDAAMRLCGLGLSQSEIEVELLRAVGHQRKMRKKVSDALKSLTIYRWFSGPERRGPPSGVTRGDNPHANTAPN